MSKKIIRNCMWIIAVCCLILGDIFKMTANNYKGIETTTGIMIDGEFQSTSQGRFGANQEKYKTFNTGGNLFFVFAGITGVVGLAMIAGDRKNKKSGGMKNVC